MFVIFFRKHTFGKNVVSKEDKEEKSVDFHNSSKKL